MGWQFGPAGSMEIMPVPEGFLSPFGGNGDASGGNGRTSTPPLRGVWDGYLLADGM